MHLNYVVVEVIIFNILVSSVASNYAEPGNSVLNKNNAVKDTVTETKRRLPQKFDLDKYMACQFNASYPFCLIDIILQKDNSTYFNEIELYSLDRKKHYNYSILHRGICVTKCLDVANNALMKYENILNDCLERKIFIENDVHVHSILIQHCDTTNKKIYNIKDIVVGVILAAILLINVFGTLNCFRKSAYNDTKWNLLLRCFSLKRNFAFFGSTRKEDSENFKAINGLKVFNMLLVIFGHCLLVIGFGYTENTNYIEQIYESPLRRIFLNGHLVVQTFFVISAFLLANQQLGLHENNAFSVNVSLKYITHRYFRLVPTLMVVVAISATLLPHLCSGPLLGLLVQRESDTCKMFWWRNLLLVQNYFSFENVCLPQTWYVAADWQMYALAIVLLTVIWRWPNVAWSLLAASFAVGILIRALQTYFQDLPPLRSTFSPEAFVKLLGDNSTLQNLYVTCQGNWSGYMIGIIAAFIYRKLKSSEGSTMALTVLKLAYWCSLPLMVLSLWLGDDLHSRDATMPEKIAYNVLDNVLFAISVAVYILGCLFQFSLPLRWMLEWNFLEPLSRLNYCVLLVHTGILRTYMAQQSRPFYASDFNLVLLWLGTTLASYVVAIPLYLFVEVPTGQMIYYFFTEKKIEKSSTI